MLLKLLRNAKGYLRFQIEGGFPEKFLNQAVEDGLQIWNMSQKDYCITAYTTPNDYHKMRRYAKRTGVRLSVAKKYGLPFVRFRYRKRWGIGAGIVIAVLGMVVMNQFLWQITIEGNQRVSRQQLLDGLRDNGVGIGSRLSQIDTLAVEQDMLLRFDNLAWIALNLEGSSLHIQVDERVLPPEPINTNDPCNVVAGKTGVIQVMEVYVGQPMKQKGEAVQEGELLVSGVVTMGEKNVLRHARAKVLAQVEEEITIEVPFRQKKQTLTGQQAVNRSLLFFDMELPITRSTLPGECQRLEEEWPVFFFGLRLPFGWKKVTQTGITSEIITLTEEEAKVQAMEQLEQERRARFGNREAQRKSLAGEVREDRFVLHALYLAVEDIAVPREILVEE